MFDLEIMVVAPDAAKRVTRKKTTARKGRGAPGRPKSASHRKAISAGLRRYWRSKRASHRRRKGKRGGTRKATAKKATRKRTSKRAKK